MAKIGTKISQGNQNLEIEMVSKKLSRISPETKRTRGP